MSSGGQNIAIISGINNTTREPSYYIFEKIIIISGGRLANMKVGLLAGNAFEKSLLYSVPAFGSPTCVAKFVVSVKAFKQMMIC